MNETKDLELIGIKDELLDILTNPDCYPEEAVAMCLTTLKSIRSQIYEKIVRLENNLLNRMEEEGATKLYFVDMAGQQKTATLKHGQMKCEKNVDVEYRANGFDPSEIGEYVFKPIWSKAKEARKVGGLKKKIIDSFFL